MSSDERTNEALLELEKECVEHELCEHEGESCIHHRIAMVARLWRTLGLPEEDHVLCQFRAELCDHEDVEGE